MHLAVIADWLASVKDKNLVPFNADVVAPKNKSPPDVIRARSVSAVLKLIYVEASLAFNDMKSVSADTSKRLLVRTNRMMGPELFVIDKSVVGDVVPIPSRPLASSVIACVKLMVFPAVPEAALNH